MYIPNYDSACKCNEICAIAYVNRTELPSYSIFNWKLYQRMELLDSSSTNEHSAEFFTNRTKRTERTSYSSTTGPVDIHGNLYKNEIAKKLVCVAIPTNNMLLWRANFQVMQRQTLEFLYIFPKSSTLSTQKEWLFICQLNEDVKRGVPSIKSMVSRALQLLEKRVISRILY